MEDFVARIADSLEGPDKIFAIEGGSPTVIESHGLLDFRDRREDAHGKKISRRARWSVGIDENPFRIELEN